MGGSVPAQRPDKYGSGPWLPCPLLRRHLLRLPQQGREVALVQATQDALTQLRRHHLVAPQRADLQEGPQAAPSSPKAGSLASEEADLQQALLEVVATSMAASHLR